ncbi:MAG: Pseudouridine synthase [candidate division TM6 bacterium GW2011_GWE2_41_16]|nr:MAG: Pseudouridine synthase [candidate division TM6 bacterium GW2011_GWE2_41_16]
MITPTIIAGTPCTINVHIDTVPVRIDTFLSHTFPQYSRSFFKRLIEEGCIIRNNFVVQKESVLVKPDDSITITIPALRDRRAIIQAAAAKEHQRTDVTIIFEHKDFLIINKPSNMVVHAPSQRSTIFSLSDWLVMQYSELETVGYEDRPGIVHRLDKDTTGIMIIPRNTQAHTAISALFKNRQLTKTYCAVVEGHPVEEGAISYPISRHPTDRNRMTHLIPTGRSALTTFSVQEYFESTALLNVCIHTGRTHQIRVHCSAIGHPVMGDPIYGHRSKLIKRQALHASSLAFEWEGTNYCFSATLPDDMNMLIKELQKRERSSHFPEGIDPLD